MERIDKHIILSCKRKERKGQKALYALLLPRLKPIANRYLRNNQYVLDVLQESFVKLFKEIDTFDENKGTIQAFASKIVINTSINFNNRIIGIRSVEIDENKWFESKPPIAESDISKEYLLSLLSEMPRSYYEVFNLYVIDGYDHEEISEILNINQSLSRKKLSRARAWIRKSEFLKNIVSLILLFISSM